MELVVFQSGLCNCGHGDVMVSEYPIPEVISLLTIIKYRKPMKFEPGSPEDEMKKLSQSIRPMKFIQFIWDVSTLQGILKIRVALNEDVQINKFSG